MFKPTLQKRVTFKRTLTTIVLGVLSMATILYGGFSLHPQKAFALNNTTVNFQARLEGAGGSIIADGLYNIRFKLYTVSSGGSSVWSEAYYDANGVTAGQDNRVQVTNGYVSVALGSQTGFGVINWDQNMWVTMDIGGTTQTATPTYDGEMAPRLGLTAVPYAFTAGQLSTANAGGTLFSTLKLAQPTVGSQTFQIGDQGAAGTYQLCVQGSTSGCTAASGSTYYIQNQNAGVQSTSNFWISGTGRADTSLLTPVVDTATTVPLDIGTASATTITIGRASQSIALPGNISLNGVSTASNSKIAVGGTVSSTATGAQYGIQVAPDFNPQGASITAIYGYQATPNIAGSALNIATFQAANLAVSTGAGYTGTVASAAALGLGGPTINGTNKFTVYRGINVGTNSTNGGNTTGSIGNYQIQIQGITAGAGTGGQVDNYGLNITQPAGTGGTTNNYGLYIQGAGSAVSGANYSLYNSSTAASYFAGDIRVGTTANAGGYALNLVGIAAASTSILTPLLDTATAVNLNIGTATATTINFGRIGQEIITPGKLHSTGNILIDGSTSNASKFQINGTVTSSVTTNLYGFSNDVDFAPTGASLANVWGVNNIANLTGSALNVTVLAGMSTQVNTGASYTGTVANARGLTVAAPTIAGTQLFTNYTGVHISPPNANTGNTSGTITNSGIVIAASSPGAGTGGIMNNYGINLTQPAGAGTGTTNNYGLFIQGAGAGSANWSIYNSSTAASYFAGNILVGTTSNAGGYALNLVGTAAASTSVLTPLIDVASAGTLSLGTGAATTVAIGGANTANLNIGTSGNNKIVTIGSSGAVNNTTAINIGNTISTGGANTVQIGGTGTNNGSNTGTTIKAQAGQTSLSIANAGATLQSFTNSTTAFQIQNSAGTSFLTADSTNQILTTKDINIGLAANTAMDGRLFSDGFEGASFKQWSGGATTSGSGAAVLDTANTRNGKYAAKLTNNAGAGSISTAIAGGTTTTVRGYVYVTSTTNHIDLMYLSNGGSNAFGLTRNNANGKLAIWNGVTSTATDTSTVLTIGAWHQIEMDLTVNAATGSITIYLDGVSVLSQTSINTGSIVPTVLTIGDNTASGRNSVVSYDDIVVDSVRPGDSSSLNVSDSLHVGGTSTFGGNVIVQTNSNSSLGFQIQNAAGTTLFAVDTSGSNIVIGTGGNTATFASTGEVSFAGTARHAKSVVVTAEYAGAVLDALSDTGGSVNCSTNNNGTMTSGYDLTNRMNYYNWTSTQVTAQCYDLVAQIPIPSDWAAWASTTPFSVQLNTSSTTNGQYAMEIRNSSGTAESSTASWGTIASLGSANTWTAVSPSTLSSTTTGYTAGDYLTIRIRTSAKSSANLKAGNITLNYLSKY